MIKVGEKLREERKRRGLTIEQIAKATKIRPNFLQAIENSDWEKLPGPNYAQGFVKNYLAYLELPISEHMARFRREYDEQAERKLIPQGLVRQEIPLRRFSMRQAFWLGGVVLLLLFGYLLFQYRAAFWAPSLVVSSPLENAKISQQTVLVQGTTDTNTAVTVNTLPAYVDANGKFTKELPVFPGSATVTVKAVNSFGKITTIERHITVVLSQ